jgi:hypothetical protein
MRQSYGKETKAIIFQQKDYIGGTFCYKFEMF